MYISTGGAWFIEPQVVTPEKEENKKKRKKLGDKSSLHVCLSSFM
jgi:hypothetical protein